MTTLLIDGDLWAYRVAAADEQVIDFGDGRFGLYSDVETGVANLDALMEDFQKRLGADRLIVAISDDANFRKTVLPTYKSNRANVRRPAILKPLLEHFRENYEVFTRPTLEADDVLGILATNPKVVPGEKIIVTMDKDLRTVPGLHWNPEKEGLTKEQRPTRITPAEADLAFYAQVLSGDMVDGYGGCPGIGKKRAEALVREPVRFVKDHREIKRGPRAGTQETIYRQEPTSDVWECIVSLYERQGFTERDALVFARVARILRHEDYNYKTKEPILWRPN